MLMSYVYPKYEPISLKNHRIPDFLRFMKLDGPIVEVSKLKEPLPIGLCYWNVDAMIRRHGGSVVHGWDVSIWRKSHISAMHHAIWKNPEGELFDVTETYPTTQTKTHSTFVSDDRIQIDLQRAPHVPGRLFSFTNNARTRDYVDTLKALHAIDKQIADILFDNGYRCENQFAMSQGLPPGTGLTNIGPLLMSQAAIAPLMSNQQAIAIKLGSSINALNAVF